MWGEKMDKYNKGSHLVNDIKYHVILVAEYRYKVLQVLIAVRARELIWQGWRLKNNNFAG